MTDLMNQSVNDEAVYRAAPGFAAGLLKQLDNVLFVFGTWAQQDITPDVEEPVVHNLEQKSKELANKDKQKNPEQSRSIDVRDKENHQNDDSNVFNNEDGVHYNLIFESRFSFLLFGFLLFCGQWEDFVMEVEVTDPVKNTLPYSLFS